MKVLIAGGGTGGHFFSGVAVGEAFLGRSSGNEVVYVGTMNGIEARVGPEQGLNVRFIDISGIKGKGLLARLKAIVAIPFAMLQSARLILREKPALVIGVGGYASGPVVLAARFLGRKTGIVEQNSVAGATNKILGHFVHRVFVAFERTVPEFPRHKVHVTGNPLREGVVQLLSLESTGTVGIGSRLKLLVLGGSQGAKPINEAMMELAAVLPPGLKKALHIVHQTGLVDEERVRAAYLEAGVEATVHGFIHEMAEEYRASDLILCRAGALTVSELSMSSRGSILIPYPQAIYNHQELNAQTLVDAGAGEMILQENLSSAVLIETLERLNNNRSALQQMAWNAGSLARPEAAAEVADEMCRVLGAY